jgi:carboxypeptidase C (cathepsin A)
MVDQPSHASIAASTHLKCFMNRAAVLLLASTLLSTIAAASELTADMVTDESIITPRTTHHSLRIGSETIRYAATFAETLLNDESGRPQATISSISYVREGVAQPFDRPVLFAFNGGPGASSSPLHFGALGPRVWAEQRATDGSRQLAENAQSLIDIADLVFIDPVGTGFSRLRPGGNPDFYWSVDGDAKAALTLIRQWLRDHDRAQSLVFIAGESYGGFRLATLAKELNDIKIGGLIFVSPMLDASASGAASGNDLPFVFDFPSMAVAAWFHGKIDRRERTVQQFYEEAAKFAQSDYVVALQQGSALPAATRAQVASQMSKFIGLPASQIEAANLRVDSEHFLQTLLQDKNLVVGRLDVRVTAPKPPPASTDPSRPPAADDPALGLKGSNVIKSGAIKEYLRRELGVETGRDYLSLTLDVNFRWNWQGPERPPAFYVNPTTNIASLMEKQPQARVLLLGGYYDLATPILAPRYSLTHANLPAERVKVVAFEAGHSPFEGNANRAEFNNAIRELIRDRQAK